jgi:hypothetical protein
MAEYRQRTAHRPSRRHRRLTDPGTAQLAWASAVVCARRFGRASFVTRDGKLITRNIRRHVLGLVSRAI